MLVVSGLLNLLLGEALLDPCSLWVAVIRRHRVILLSARLYAASVIEVIVQTDLVVIFGDSRSAN